MIVRIVRLTLKQEHLAAFERLFHAHHDAIESQPGRGVELLTTLPILACGAPEPRDAESDLNAYRSLRSLGRFGLATKAMFDAPDGVDLRSGRRGKG